MPFANFDFQTAVFFAFAAILLFAAARVITARNPVHAALHLILAFFTCGALWALLQAEFLAIAIILVYVGAVMVLFLFVVMMLDINLDRLRQGFWKHLPLGAMIGALLALEMILVLGSRYFYIPASEVLEPAGVSNVKGIAALMFSDYVLPFELASIVLLVGMIAAVVLTQRGTRKNKYSHPSDQLAVKARDRVRVLQMPVEKE